MRNFKSIGTADLELAPLTVLVGANSTGKSSLLQSMLLAAQAAGAPQGEPGIPLNGALVELGELAELRRAGAGAREAVALGCTVAGGGSRPDEGRERRWLAACEPVLVKGREDSAKNTGLFVIVQEECDTPRAE